MSQKYQDAPVPKGYEVAWEKWIDAYDDEDEKYHNAVESNDEVDDAFFEDELDIQFSKPIKTLMTPFGALPLTEQSLASKYFRFWVGHTNFKITKRHVGLISACDGVETIDVLTPYRFRIGIAILFSEPDVKINVKKALLNTMSPS